MCEWLSGTTTVKRPRLKPVLQRTARGACLLLCPRDPPSIPPVKGEDETQPHSAGRAGRCRPIRWGYVSLAVYRTKTRCNRHANCPSKSSSTVQVGTEVEFPRNQRTGQLLLLQAKETQTSQPSTRILVAGLPAWLSGTRGQRLSLIRATRANRSVPPAGGSSAHAAGRHPDGTRPLPSASCSMTEVSPLSQSPCDAPGVDGRKSAAGQSASSSVATPGSFPTRTTSDRPAGVPGLPPSETGQSRILGTARAVRRRYSMTAALSCQAGQFRFFFASSSSRNSACRRSFEHLRDAVSESRPPAAAGGPRAGQRLFLHRDRQGHRLLLRLVEISWASTSCP